MGREGRIAAVALIAAALLACCGADKPAAPTEPQMLIGLWLFWQDGLPVYLYNADKNYTGLLNPVAVHVIGDGITTVVGGETRYVVPASYSFEILLDLTYDCDPSAVGHIRAADARNPFRYPHAAHPREVISCSGPATFVQKDGRWMMHFDMPVGVSPDYALER